MTHPLTLLLSGIIVLSLLTWFFWPNLGLWSLWKKMRRDSERIRIEDALKHLYNNEYMRRETSLEGIAGKLGLSRNQAAKLTRTMEENGLITSQPGYYRLTAEGSAYALRMVRAHRLWERYLADETGLQEKEWHRVADDREHNTSIEQLETMCCRLGNPMYDPHGAPIPTSKGEVSPPKGLPVTMCQVGDLVTVTQIEDEPDQIYAQIVAEGIYPGMRMKVLEMSNYRLRLGSQQEEHVLSPIAAARICVVPLKEDQQEENQNTLASLQLGERGRVKEIAPYCRGIERRRLMDLGVVPGTLIEAEREGLFRDPKAYRIRGSVIALRRELANLIYIEKEKGVA